ncbi:hypothetical protein ALCH109712_02200 [Alkalicoccus chagannorensis]
MKNFWVIAGAALFAVALFNVIFFAIGWLMLRM